MCLKMDARNILNIGSLRIIFVDMIYIAHYKFSMKENPIDISLYILYLFLRMSLPK